MPKSWMAGQGAGPGRAGEQGEIERALASLPGEQREAVLLVMVEGYSYVDAAEIIGCSTRTLATRLVRGRDTLLELLKNGL